MFYDKGTTLNLYSSCFICETVDTIAMLNTHIHMHTKQNSGGFIRYCGNRIYHFPVHAVNADVMVNVMGQVLAGDFVREEKSFWKEEATWQIF